MRTLPGAFALLVCSHLAAQQPVAPGARIDFSLSGGETRRWEIHLAKNDYLHAVFLQKGVDIVVRVLGPGNEELSNIDSPNSDWGPEPIFFIAPVDGTYRIEAVADGTAPRGDVEFSVIDVRPANAADAKLVALENSGYRSLMGNQGSEALAAFQQCGDRYAAGLALWVLGNADQKAHQFENAIGHYEQALAIQQEMKDQRAESNTLIGLGDASYYLNQLDKAIGYYEQALAIQRGIKDQRGANNTLISLGDTCYFLNQFDKAIGYYEQALAIRLELKDRPGEMTMDFHLASTYEALGRHDKAIASLEQTLALARELKDRTTESLALNSLGATYNNWSRYDKAIGYLEQALALRRELKDRPGEASTLKNLGFSCNNLGRYNQAISYFEQALVIQRELKDRQAEGHTLANLGTAYEGLSQYEKAIGFDEQALAIARAEKNRLEEGLALNNLGGAYEDLNQYDRAISDLNEALSIARELKNRPFAGTILLNLGNVYDDLSRYDKAIEAYQQTLAIVREFDDRATEGIVLNNLGMVHLWLNRYDQAIPYFEQALAIRREVKDRFGESTTLINLGYSYDGLIQYEKATGYYEQALTLAREVKNRSKEATALNNLGSVASARHRYEQAIEYYQQALAIHREVKDRSGEGTTINNLGGQYRRMGQFEKAAEYFEQALAIEREVKNRAGEGTTLANLMETQRQRGQPSLAICYGKLAVNVFEQIRFENSGLKADLQASLDDSYRKYYADLAALLAAQGRIFEALEVMDLLKQKEVSEYLRSEAPRAGEARSLPMNDAEARAVSLIDSAAEYRGLMAKPDRTPADASRLAQLYGQMRSGVTDFNSQMAVIFDRPEKQQDLQAVRQHTAALQSILSKLGPSAVAVYTLLSEKELHLFLVTPEVVLPFSTLVERPKVYELIAGLQMKLRNGQSDPLPEAQALYKLLVAPLRRALDETHARVIYWHLHDQLRYVPVAALHDGSGYLAERYENVLLNVQNQASLMEPRISQWTASGFGVTKSHGDFPALPNVGNELQQMMGALPGQILLDEKFTLDTFVQQMFQQRPVVHIASHFYFDPTAGSQSFLLLGDGNKLSIADMEGMPNLFQGADLVTFSACETALGQKDKSGIEIDALSDVAMLKGARAILASLWPVDDESTALLMSEFYRLRQRENLTKAEALRRAQAAMIHGELKPGSDSVDARGVKVTAAQRAKDYSHPHYWAPFILIGNLQ